MNKDKNALPSGLVFLGFLPEVPEANARQMEGEPDSRLEFSRGIAPP
jgi:hypothetical protein